MNGAVDPVYVRARRALLDALTALTLHLEAIVLVGAQAIYLHTGEGDIAVAPYTTDGDLTLAPDALPSAPLLGEALSEARFTQTDQPGSWRSPEGVIVDIMVPASFGGPGSRGARLGSHGKRAARKAKGLEAALVDRSKMRVGSFEASDIREVEVWVAGPAALLVAKLHKIAERADSPGRREDKDALDVLRLLRRLPTAELAEAFARLASSPSATEVSAEALEILRQLFDDAEAKGSRMAARATEGLEDPEQIATSCAFLARDLLDAASILLRNGRRA